jgi:hypothetical protein
VIPMPRDAWSPDEVRRAVADYLDMLSQELLGSPYSKTAHRNELLPKLRSRTAGAVERKHQNISAILIEAGLPAIDGYKPLFNYQTALRDEVLSNVSRQTDVLGLIRRIEVTVPPSSQFRELDPGAITVPAPERRDLRVGKSRDLDWRKSARKYDFELREERLRRVGRAGEEFVVEYEKAKLISAGRSDLANRVEWVTDTLGDGAGFDILSYDERARELYVEVKTTNFDKYQPFLISRNEVSFSTRHAERYSLYRVFHFALAPKLFRLDGSVEKAVQLSPLVFEGKL